LSEWEKIMCSRRFESVGHAKWNDNDSIGGVERKEGGGMHGWDRKQEDNQEEEGKAEINVSHGRVQRGRSQ